MTGRIEAEADQMKLIRGEQPTRNRDRTTANEAWAFKLSFNCENEATRIPNHPTPSVNLAKNKDGIEYSTSLGPIVDVR
jgi:hypothetical protein